MFTSLVYVQSVIELSELVENKEFTWHQFHFEGWGAQDFEGHAPVAVHNATGRAVPLTWFLLKIQSTVDLIANAKILVNTRKVQGETP